MFNASSLTTMEINTSHSITSEPRTTSSTALNTTSSLSSTQISTVKSTPTESRISSTAATEVSTIKPASSKASLSGSTTTEVSAIQSFSKETSVSSSTTIKFSIIKSSTTETITSSSTTTPKISGNNSSPVVTSASVSTTVEVGSASTSTQTKNRTVTTAMPAKTLTTKKLYPKSTKIVYTSPTLSSILNGPSKVTINNPAVNESLNKSNSEQTNQSLGTVVASCMSILVLIIVIVVVITIVYRKRRRGNLNQDLYGLCKKDSYTTADLLDLSNLLIQAKHIRSDETFATKFSNDLIGSTVEDELHEYENTILIPTCRYPLLKCLKRSQVQVSSAPKFILHMNKFHDYFNRPLFLAQAPLQEEFDLYWQAILQQQIGTVVWVGELIENNKTQISSYIPMKKSAIRRFGRLEVSNVNASHSFYEGVDIYSIIVKRPSGEPDKSFPRKMFFIHFRSWPTKFTGFQLSKINECLKKLAAIHKSQQGNNLPGLLFHCTDGVEKSATLSAIYIAQQMWFDHKLVHIVGIMRYIRHYRHCAFTYRKLVHKNVQIVFGAMKSLTESKLKSKSK